MEIPINKIKISIDNPRKNFKAINELAEDIKKNGLIHKILVRPHGDYFEIVQGERRFRALQLLQRDKVDCEVRELTTEQAQDIRLSENIQREDLSVIELANEFKRRLETTTQQQLAKQIGKSQPYINKILSFLELSHDAKVFLDNDMITQEHARELLYFQKYLKMLGYDKKDVYEFQGRQISLMDTLISDIAEWTFFENKNAGELHKLIDINIYERIRYELKQKGKKIIIDDVELKTFLGFL